MNIGILTSTDTQLRRQLAANESQADAAAQSAETEIVAAPKPRPTHNIAPSVPFPSLRAALDARIAADISTGELPAEDASTVQRTLDAIDDRRPAPVSTVARAYLATIARGTLIDRWA